MSRPALIIGLGGTGQWVLTFLKKDLLESGEGRMPAGVKLLCFDTTSQATAATGRGARKQNENAPHVGAVELTRDIEFIPIGGNVGQLVSQIASGSHQHMEWFPAASFLGKLPPAAFNTKEGSGQIRQFGRISLFNDLAALRNSNILTRLRAAMESLQKNISRDRQLEVIIVSSLAGGTGAGMMVDIALIVRELAQHLVSNNYVVRGFFLLPRAFSSGHDQDMLARSFAAWRELDRFMIVSERFGLRQINYHQREQDLRIHISKRAYDVSYLIDSARLGENSLENVAPEEGVYPAIAHCISAFLDEIAGARYTEFVATNLAGQLAQLPRSAYHSAIGSYTFKVPAYYSQKKFFHQQTLDVLNHFLAPIKSDKGFAYKVSDQLNREVAEGYSGWLAVRDFMEATGLNVNGNEIPNTMLLTLIASVRIQEGQRQANVLQIWARGDRSRADHMIVNGLINIGQDEDSKYIVEKIDEELNLRIDAVLPPSRIFGDTPEQGYMRITGRIEEIIHEHYGRYDAEGEQLRGKYGQALAQVQQKQISRFQKLLAAWTEINLNGLSDHPMPARSGKIGYVRNFYVELIATFDYFVTFLNMVRQLRNMDFKIMAYVLNEVKKTQHVYYQKRDRRHLLFFWDSFIHPDAYNAQEDYLRAQQKRIDVLKYEILLNGLAETALTIRDYTQQTLREIDNWITHLVTGAPGTTSLYQATVASLDNVNVNHELDKRSSRVMEIVGEHIYQRNEEHISQMLQKLVWHVENANNRLHIDLGIEKLADIPDAPPHYEPFHRDGEMPEKNNLDKLIELAERSNVTLHQEGSLAQAILDVYSTGKILAEATNQKASPLYLTSTTELEPRVSACYIRVHFDLDERITNYFRDYEEQMLALNPHISGNNLQLVDSEDPHKMTIIRSDDLMPSNNFEMFQLCQDAYIRTVTDPFRGVPAAELHVFPAEINASYYEAELPRLLQQSYKVLHPEVVALLEDRERLEMFFRAWALGFVYLNEAEGQPYWAYKLPEDEEVLFITVPVDTLEGHVSTDIFQVIHNFVNECRDQRVGVGSTLRIDWEKLRMAILTRQRRIGTESAASLYQSAQSRFAEMVEPIRKIQPPTLQKVVVRNQQYIDLVDLASIIFLRAIEAVQTERRAGLRQFFRRAGIRFEAKDKIGWFLCHVEEIWETEFDKPVCTFLHLGSALDHNTVIEIRNSAPITESEIHNVLFVIIDQTPEESAYSQMATYRTAGFQIIPIDDVLLRYEYDQTKLRNLFKERIHKFHTTKQDLYNKTGAVADRLNFFGRETRVNKIIKTLVLGQSLALFGIRKIGKSSLLHSIRNQALFPIAYVDLQLAPELTRLFNRVMTAWQYSLSHKEFSISWEATKLQNDENIEDACLQFSDATLTLIELIRESGREPRLGLLIDEPEVLLPDLNNPTPEKLRNYLAFARTLRGLVQETGCLSLLVAGVDPTINRVNRLGKEQNPFYQFFQEEYLGALEHQDCIQMIRNIGKQMGVSYTEDALEFVANISGGHPFLARQLCHITLMSLDKLASLPISLSQVQTAADLFIQAPNTAVLLDNYGLWGELTNEGIWNIEQVYENDRILRALASLEPQLRSDLLATSRYPAAANFSSYELEQRSVIGPFQEGLAIRLGLFGRWIRKYKLNKWQHDA